MILRILTLVLLLASGFTSARADDMEIILLNGKIVSGNERGTVYQALAVIDGRIAAMGNSVEIRRLAGRTTRIVDLGGRTVIPGLIDSHIHAIRAALSYSTEVHWIGVPTLAQALERLRAAAKTAKPGDWLIVAGGWTEEQFQEKRRPTQAEITAAAPGNPVYIQWMYDWAMLNPAGYKALNISNESDLPGGGKFAKDDSGQLNGAVLGGIVPLFDKLPKPVFAQKLEGTRKFFRELNRMGLTGLIDPGGFNMTPAEYAPLFRVWRDRQLTLRVNYSYFAQKRGAELDEFKELTQLLPMGLGDEMLRFNGIGERVTFGMYNNDKPSDADKEQFYLAAKWAAENGLTLTQHWHSDASVGHLLDVFERVNREIPIAKLRWSIAHLNDGTEATFNRMKALGVGWAMQDAMVMEGDRLLKTRGEAVLSRMPPLKTASKSGVMIGAGTDAHRVANYNPFVALRWMLDGKTAAGAATRGPQETPDRLEALRFYTQGSAWFAHDEQNRGTLAMGKLADLAVLSKDYLSVPVADIGNITSVLTLVGGKVVFADAPFAALEDKR